MPLQIDVVPAFTDNYIWLVRQAEQGQVFVVDPGDAAPVLDYLRRTGHELAGILLTHHHPDHTGGVAQLLDHARVPVYGPQSERIPAVTRTLADGDQFSILDTRIDVISVPGHTLDHIAFFVADAGDNTPLLFCGDTLFAAGCGRLFEGDPAMMLNSLKKLTPLPEQTLVYCAHEYTRANLAFARSAEPDNPDTAARAREVEQLRQQGLMTLPSQLAIEKRTNPFLRCHTESVIRQCVQHAGKPLTTEKDVFATLRQWKDSF